MRFLPILLAGAALLATSTAAAAPAVDPTARALARSAAAKADEAQADADVALSRGSILVKMAASQTAADYSAGAAIPFDTVADDAGDFTLSGGGVVVPSGVTHVVVVFRPFVSSFTSAEAAVYAVWKNGAALSPTVQIVSSTVSTTVSTMITSYEIPVSEGDVLTGRIDTVADTSITVYSEAFLFVKAVP